MVVKGREERDKRFYSDNYKDNDYFLDRNNVTAIKLVERYIEERGKTPTGIPTLYVLTEERPDEAQEYWKKEGKLIDQLRSELDYMRSAETIDKNKAAMTEDFFYWFAYAELSKMHAYRSH